MTVADLDERWRAARPFVLVGSTCIVAGGLVAAVTGPTDLEHGSWLAAYLVLVGGVAQVALGAGQAWLAVTLPSGRSMTVEAWSWNAGAAAVAIGTLASQPLATTVGGVASAASVVLFLRGARPARPTRRVAGTAYRVVAALVLLSTPVGIALAWTRHG